MSNATILPRGDRRISWLLAGVIGGVVAAILLAPSLIGPTRAADPTTGTTGTTDTTKTISVTGDGRVIIKPDVADINLGVNIDKPRAGDAEAAAADAMAKVIDALKAAGIADADIQTTTLSLQPQYDWSSGSSNPRITGYEMDNEVDVTVRDLTKVGSDVDAAVDAGATSVNGITFRVENQTAAEQQARTAAMTDARAKADTLATAAGVSITSVVSISEVSAPAPTPIMYAAPAAAGAADGRAVTPVQPGNVEVDITVTVVYGIG